MNDRNLRVLENEITRAQALDYAPPSRALDDLGRMSADAVLAQYEATAKEVEAMGDLVKASVRKLGQSLIECDNDMKVVAETAAAIRDKGKHHEALISQISDMSKAIREACAAFQKQMGA